MKKLILVLAVATFSSNIQAAFHMPAKTVQSVEPKAPAQQLTSISQQSATVVEIQADQAQIKASAGTSMSKGSRGGGGKSQVVALILCLLVGGLGIHRFYLGYTWQGIVQLLTLGGLGIWTLIDLIRIITGSLQPKDGSYDTTL